MMPEEEMLRPELKAALEHAKKTGKFLFVFTDLTSEEVTKWLVPLLRSNTIQLTELSCYQNRNIGDKEVEEIAEALKGNNTLTTLDFRQTSVGDRGVEAIIKAFSESKNTPLTKLFVGAAFSSNTDLQMLLKRNEELVFQQSHQKLLNETAMSAHDQEILELPYNLKSLSGTEMDTWLLPLLQDNTIKSLQVGCQLDKDAFESLMGFLKKNITLTSLVVKIQLDPHEETLLSEALGQNKMLTYLKITNPSSAGAHLLVRSLKNNLTLISLEGLEQHPKMQAGIQALLRRNRALLKVSQRNALIGSLMEQAKHGQIFDPELVSKIIYMAGLASPSEHAFQTRLQKEAHKEKNWITEKIVVLANSLQKSIEALRKTPVMDHGDKLETIINGINTDMERLRKEAETGKYTADAQKINAAILDLKNKFEKVQFKDVIGIDAVIAHLEKECKNVVELCSRTLSKKITPGYDKKQAIQREQEIKEQEITIHVASPLNPVIETQAFIERLTDQMRGERQPGKRLTPEREEAIKSQITQSIESISAATSGYILPDPKKAAERVEDFIQTFRDDCLDAANPEHDLDVEVGDIRRIVNQLRQACASIFRDTPSVDRGRTL